MFNRNTYGDPKRNPKSHTSRERLSMTAQQTAQSHARQHTQTHQAEQMNKTINNTLHKISNQSRRYSLSTALRPNQKTLYCTIASFLNSFDQNFDTSMIQNTEMITEIYRILGYPQPINKTIFQPIGAPHTWNSCLQILEWLAQITNFHFEYRIQQQQYERKENINDAMLDAFLTDNSKIIEIFLKKQVDEIRNELDQIQYDNQSQEMAIKNLNNSQKDLLQMDAQTKRLQNLLFREKQTVISIDQQNTVLLKQIQKATSQLDQFENDGKILDKEILYLQQQINHQELSAQEIQRINSDIVALQSRIITAKQNHGQRIEQLNKAKNGAIQDYMDIQNQISQFNKIYTKVRERCEKKNYKLQLPQLQRSRFINYMNSMEAPSEQQEKQLWKNQFIAKICSEQQNFYTLCEMETKELDQKNKNLKLDKSQYQVQKSSFTNKQNQLREVVEKLSQQAAHLKVQINVCTEHFQNLKAKIYDTQIRIKGKEAKKQELKAEIQKMTPQTKKLIQFNKVYQKHCQDTLAKAQDQIKKLTITYQKLLTNHNSSLIDINGQLDMLMREE